MIKIGTWKGEPASEEHWEVDWSMSEPDPDYVDREGFYTLFPINSPKYYKHQEFNGEGI